MWDEEDDGGDDGEIAIRPDPAIVEVGKVLVKVIFDLSIKPQYYS